MDFFQKSELPEEDMLDLDSSQIEDSKKSIFSRIFKNEEGQIYSDIITKGFVWVLMFFVSLVALVLVFKDDYNTNKEVVVVNNSKTDGSYMSDYTGDNSNNNNNFAFNNQNDNTLDSGKSVKNNSDANNKAQTTNNSGNSKVKNSNSPAISNNSNSDSNSTPSNSTITNIIRDSGKQNQQTLPKDDSLNANNIAAVPPITDKPSKPTAASVPKAKVVKPQMEIAQAKPALNIPKAASALNMSDVWLVTVFSGASLDLAKQKWNNIQNANPNLFVNKKPYFVKSAVTGKGLYYRVSLGDADTDDNYPMFKDANSAGKYCKFLKAQNVDCFITKTSKSVIMSLINMSR